MDARSLIFVAFAAIVPAVHAWDWRTDWRMRGDIYRTEYGSIYLGLTLTALPLILVYFAFSKYIIAGVALGGVKE